MTARRCLHPPPTDSFTRHYFLSDCVVHFTSSSRRYWLDVKGQTLRGSSPSSNPPDNPVGQLIFPVTDRQTEARREGARGGTAEPRKTPPASRPTPPTNMGAAPEAQAGPETRFRPRPPTPPLRRRPTSRQAERPADPKGRASRLPTDRAGEGVGGRGGSPALLPLQRQLTTGADTPHKRLREREPPAPAQSFVAHCRNRKSRLPEIGSGKGIG